MIGSAHALRSPIRQAKDTHVGLESRDARQPLGVARVPRGSVAAVVSIMCHGAHAGSRRHLKKRLEQIGKAAEETPTKPAGSAAVISGSQGVLDRLWQNQRQSMTVLFAGIVFAMLFGTYVTLSMGPVAGAEWFACYVIEYSLSVDNLFVFIVIFDYFKVTGERQSQVLNYGVAGAVILRFLFVYLGAQLLQRFDFLILAFSVILIWASYQGLSKPDDDDDEDDSIEGSAIYQTLTKMVEISPRLDGDNFFTKVDGRFVATPLLLCLLVIEFSDIVFATDSVPAVLGTTQDPFIAYSSNIFAVFGLRSLFFILREAMTRFTYLEPAVSIVLGFIGVKIVVDYFNIIEVPVMLSLSIVLSILTLGVVLSVQELEALEVPAEPISKSE